MASKADIKRRMSSVNSTMQITKAMKLVAVSKFKKAKNLAEDTLSYFGALEEIIMNAASGLTEDENGYITGKANNKNALYVVVTADRGMCGGYNMNIIKEVISHINEEKIEKAYVILVGNKGKKVFQKAGIEIVECIEGISESPSYQEARAIADTAKKFFDEGKVGKLYVGFTSFKSAIQQYPTVSQILPIKVDKSVKTDKLVEFDPGIDEVMNWALNKYLSTMVYKAMVQSWASQEGARMTAMDSATDNATEMINNLTLTFNRARQSAITQEISEIVGGAEAIK